MKVQESEKEVGDEKKVLKMEEKHQQRARELTAFFFLLFLL